MGIFNSGSSNQTCPMPRDLVADASSPIYGTTSFRQFNMILSGACAAFSSLSIFILMARHAAHYSKPNEQSKILKICALIPLYSIVSFITIAEPNTYVYLTPWLHVFQAWALGSFFLLLCEFVSPSAEFRDVFFAALVVPQGRRGGNQQVNGLVWYRKLWFAVLQYIPVAIGVAVVTAITQAANVYCMTSNKPHFAHLWLSIIIDISLVLAVLAVVRIFMVLKKDLKHHNPMGKFLAFKLIIFISFVQKIVFWILRSTNVLKETSKLTYADVNFGIETMLVCIEMVPFSVFFHFAYNVSAYDLSKARPLPLSDIASGHKHNDVEASQTAQQQQDQPETFKYTAGGSYHGGLLGFNAWLGLLDPREILRAMKFALQMRGESRTAGMDAGYVAAAPPAYQTRR